MIDVVVSWLQRFVYQSQPSLFIKVMCVVSMASLANLGISEIQGKHLQYSKFWDSIKYPRTRRQNIVVPSKTGMLILYSPALLASLVSSFMLLPHKGFRFLLLNSALTIHFFKRICEVLFIHKYGGGMALVSVIPISTSYFMSTATMIYAQYLTQDSSDPQIDLKYIGILLFLIGIVGNFYHHYLLMKLRGSNDKEYKIPRGGLFGLVVCPHYLFEILGIFGVSLISQTLYSFSFFAGTTFYLMGRSYATKRWYISKFDDFPKDLKALVPYIF